MNEQDGVAAMEAWVVAETRRLQAESNLMDGSAEHWRKFLFCCYQFEHSDLVDDTMFDKSMRMRSVPGEDWPFREHQLVRRAAIAAYHIVLKHPGQLEQPHMGRLRDWATVEFFYALKWVSSRPPEDKVNWIVGCMNIGIAGERLGLWTSDAYVPLP